MSSKVYVVLDGSAQGNNLTLGGGKWSISTWPGNSLSAKASSPEFAWTGGPASAASLVLTWEGIAIGIWGTTATLSQNFQVALDGNAPYTTSTTDSNPQTYMQWYQSPVLPPGTHILNVTGIRAMTVDFFLVTPGPQTSLAGRQLLVDDDYVGITYNGTGWVESTEMKFLEASFTNGDPSYSSQPTGNSTHQTSTPGDSFSFSFTGTRAQFYGILLRDKAGSVGFKYSIDGGQMLSSTQTFTETEGLGDALNHLLLDTGTLPARNHTVSLQVSSMKNQPFIFDYILYTPSFSTLDAMPNLLSGNASTAPSPSNPQPSPTDTNNTSASSSKRSSVGPIVGGVVAAIVIMIIVALLLLRWLRRRHHQAKDKEMEETASPFPHSPAFMVQTPTSERGLLAAPTADMDEPPVSPALTSGSTTLASPRKQRIEWNPTVAPSQTATAENDASSQSDRSNLPPYLDRESTVADHDGSRRRVESWNRSEGLVSPTPLPGYEP